MKRLILRPYEVGVVYRKGYFYRALTTGKYWLRPFDYVSKYNVNEAFTISKDLDVLLHDTQFASLVQVTEIPDNHVAVLYINDRIMGTVKPGRYINWKGLISYRYDIFDMSELFVPTSVKKSAAVLNALQGYIRSFHVDSFEKGILLVDGEAQKIVTQGIYRFWRNSNEVALVKTDLRQKQMEISGQELLTKDKAALRMSLYAQYRVTDVETALLKNKDYEKQLYVLVQLALRTYIGKRTLDDVLANKSDMSQHILNEVKGRAIRLGVEINTADIRDIILPGEMKNIMNQVLMAEKQAQANTIMRREETASTRSLLNTAKLMEDNAMLLKLKEMEYVEKIAEKISNISLSGGNQIIDQLSDIFVVK